MSTVKQRRGKSAALELGRIFTDAQVASGTLKRTSVGKPKWDEKEVSMVVNRTCVYIWPEPKHTLNRSVFNKWMTNKNEYPTDAESARLIALVRKVRAWIEHGVSPLSAVVNAISEFEVLAANKAERADRPNRRRRRVIREVS